MVDSVQPSRQQADLAEVVEMLLDKGVVINADIAVSVGDTQLLGIQLRAALASFETAAEYGLEFPEGTDMERVAEAVGDPSIAEEGPTAPIDATRGVNVSSEDDESEGDDATDDAGERSTDSRSARPDPETPTGGDVDVFEGGPLDTGDEESENGSESDDGGEDDEPEATPEAETGDGGGGGE